MWIALCVFICFIRVLAALLNQLPVSLSSWSDCWAREQALLNNSITAIKGVASVRHHSVRRESSWRLAAASQAPFRPREPRPTWRKSPNQPWWVLYMELFTLGWLGNVDTVLPASLTKNFPVSKPTNGVIIQFLSWEISCHHVPYSCITGQPSNQIGHFSNQILKFSDWIGHFSDNIVHASGPMLLKSF